MAFLLHKTIVLKGIEIQNSLTHCNVQDYLDYAFFSFLATQREFVFYFWKKRRTVISIGHCWCLSKKKVTYEEQAFHHVKSVNRKSKCVKKVTHKGIVSAYLRGCPMSIALHQPKNAQIQHRTNNSISYKLWKRFQCQPFKVKQSN